jgi:hypothetical protein
MTMSQLAINSQLLDLLSAQGFSTVVSLNQSLQPTLTTTALSSPANASGVLPHVGFVSGSALPSSHVNITTASGPSPGLSPAIIAQHTSSGAAAPFPVAPATSFVQENGSVQASDISGLQHHAVGLASPSLHRPGHSLYVKGLPRGDILQFLNGHGGPVRPLMCALGLCGCRWLIVWLLAVAQLSSLPEFYPNS